MAGNAILQPQEGINTPDFTVGLEATLRDLLEFKNKKNSMFWFPTILEMMFPRIR